MLMQNLKVDGVMGCMIGSRQIGPNLPLFQGGQLGPGQLGPGAQLSGAQLSGAQFA